MRMAAHQQAVAGWPPAANAHRLGWPHTGQLAAHAWAAMGASNPPLPAAFYTGPANSNIIRMINM